MSITTDTKPASGGNGSRTSLRTDAREHESFETATFPGMPLRQVIVVQGGSGSGKTTIGKELAKKLGWVHFSSGLLYRAAGFLAAEADLPLNKPDAVTAAVTRAFTPEGFRKGDEVFSFSLRVVESNGLRRIKIFLERRNDSQPKKPAVDITELLHDNEEVSRRSSEVAEIPSLREYFRGMQLRRLPCADLVIDGRDSHKIFGKAIIGKFWVETSPDICAARALAHRKIYPGDVRFPVEFAMAKASLTNRDQKDRLRAVDPATRPRTGFQTLKNDGSSVDPVVVSMLRAVLPKIKS